jgi:hypothetical protein
VRGLIKGGDMQSDWLRPTEPVTEDMLISC